MRAQVIVVVTPRVFCHVQPVVTRGHPSTAQLTMIAIVRRGAHAVPQPGEKRRPILKNYTQLFLDLVDRFSGSSTVVGA